MGENGYTLGDLAAVTKSSTGGMSGVGSDGLWVFALLILLFGGGGFGFGGNRVGEAYATQADVQRAVDLNQLTTGQRDIESVIRSTTADTIAAVKDGNFNTLGEMRDIQQAVYNNGAALQNCCCNMEKVILENRYLDEKNASNIMANDTANTQKVLDAITGNRIADMQNQINQLQLQSAFCGVPRISPYGYGIVPNFASCGCGTGCAYTTNI